MLIYDTQFINNYCKTLENEKLEQSIQSLLDSILVTINNDISLNIYELEADNKLKKKSKYKKYDSYNGAKDFNTINKFNKFNPIQTNCIRKPPIDKTKINIAKSNIKALLNKLSPSNYNKLETEFLVIYSELLDSSIQENLDELFSMDNYIIDYICYNNISYSSIYVNIFFSLLNIYYTKNYKLEDIFLYNLLKEKYEDFLNFEKYIKCTSNKDDDEFAINKNNDKYKCFIIFVINIYKKFFLYEVASLEKIGQIRQIDEITQTNYMSNLFINTQVIEEYILLLNNFFINNLQIEKNNTYCENILEFLMTLYNELFKEIRIIKKVDASLKIYENINSIIANKSNYTCFTNKIKFKLMDIQDKYKKYIIV
jgi:hypothetical protein